MVIESRIANKVKEKENHSLPQKILKNGDGRSGEGKKTKKTEYQASLPSHLPHSPHNSLEESTFTSQKSHQFAASQGYRNLHLPPPFLLSFPPLPCPRHLLLFTLSSSSSNPHRLPTPTPSSYTTSQSLTNTSPSLLSTPICSSSRFTGRGRRGGAGVVDGSASEVNVFIGLR